MSCLHQQQVLRGESPGEVDVDHLTGCEVCSALAVGLAEIDQLAAQLPELRVPPALSARTAALMQAEASQSTHAHSPSLRRRRRAWLGGTMSLSAAAALFLFVWPKAPAPDPTTMVERGVGDRTPEVDLKVAVEHAGKLERLCQTAEYEAGDVLYFRGAVDQAAEVALLRVDAEGARMVHEQALTIGDWDLISNQVPLAWQIDPGESDAVWALLGAAGTIDAEAARKALASTYDNGDPQAVCARALQMGLRCAAVTVSTRGPTP
jgi:hypothetical protein